MRLRIRQPSFGDSAFTMVEIALCLAIIGFALVAIIGVLPAGLNVQKENREDTILNQDATVWLAAIRSGAVGYNELTNYVDRVVVQSQNYDTNGKTVGGLVTTVAEPATPTLGDANHQVTLAGVPDGGAALVGLLSTPRYAQPTKNAPAGASYSMNSVYAYVRAMSGSAVNMAPQDNPDVRDLSFSYRMVVELVPNGQNLTDVRLQFQWPLKRPFNRSLPIDEPEVGKARMVFRTEIGGHVLSPPETDFFKEYPEVSFYFIQPYDYYHP